MTPRVLAVIDSIKLGGPGRGLIQLAERSAKNDVQFELANFDHSPGQKSEFIEALETRGIPLSLIPRTGRLDMTAISQLQAIIHHNDINIIQSHGYISHLFAFVAARKCRIPWVSVNHGWTDEDFKVRLYNRIERMLIRFADHSIVVSDALLREISNIRGKRKPTIYIGNAIDPQQLAAKNKRDVREEMRTHPDTVLLGVFGRLSYEKGTDIALQALQLVSRSTDSRVELLVVGSGPMAAELEQLAADLGIDHLVHFAGHQNQIGNYFAAIDALLLPSRSEGMPNVVMESLALAKPVIATNVGDVGKIIVNEENGWICRPDSVDALASSMRSALRDRNSWPAMGENGKASIYPLYCPDERAKTFARFYRSVLAQNFGETDQ